MTAETPGASRPAGGGRERVCFLMHLRPEMVEEYLQAHADVWPEMLDALRRSGWHDYSLFLRPEDGLVVGYLVTDDFATAQRAMEREQVNERWQATMSRFFAAPDGSRRPDQGVERLVEYFHLS